MEKRKLSQTNSLLENSVKRRRIVSPVKKFDVLKACDKLLMDLRTNEKHRHYAHIFYEPVDPGK